MYTPCLGSACSWCCMGWLTKSSWCASCRQPGKKRLTTPAFEIACALQEAAPAPPPQTAAPTSLHASMASNAFLIIQHVVTLLAAKRVPSRFCCTALLLNSLGLMSAHLCCLHHCCMRACSPRLALPKCCMGSASSDTLPIWPLRMSTACLQ